EKARVPIAMTLLGIGGVPAHHPLNLGMMGMHGEAWVNTAIQEADLLIALGMRFDDRVTGNLKTYALSAKKIHVDIDRSELNKNVRVDVAIAKDLRTALVEWLPHVEKRDRSAWLASIGAMKGDSAVRDIQQLPDDGPTRRRSVGRLRRRWLPDDDVRAGDDRAGRSRRQRGHHQQRVSRDGPAVAGVLLRQAVRGDTAPRSRLREARAGLWHHRRG